MQTLEFSLKQHCMSVPCLFVVADIDDKAASNLKNWNFKSFWDFLLLLLLLLVFLTGIHFVEEKDLHRADFKMLSDFYHWDLDLSQTSGFISKKSDCSAHDIIIEEKCPVFVTAVCLLVNISSFPLRQPRSGLHVRHLLSRCGLHVGASLQPRRAGLLLMWSHEEGLVAGRQGLFWLGRLQWPCWPRHALQPGLCGRQGEEREGRPGTDELAQQSSWQEGEKALIDPTPVEIT